MFSQPQSTLLRAELRHSAKPPIALHKQGMSVVVVRDVATLSKYVEEWEELATNAVEQNVFYEPWMLLPAIKLWGAGKDLDFVLIFAHEPRGQSDHPMMCGFFPLERQHRYKGLWISTRKLWRHKHCYLCTPLVRSEYARECLHAFFGWLASDPIRNALVELGNITGEGLLHQLLIDHFSERGSLTFILEQNTRAFFQPRANGHEYVRAARSGEWRRKMKRQEKQLAAIGSLQYRLLEPDGNVEGWIEEFLRLETGGWKGLEGSALALNEEDQAFFRAVNTEAFRRGRLMALALHLNDKPIAQRHSFLAGRGSFAFKTAFDERFAHFSPGTLVELENIHRLHARPEIDWMDSCTVPDNFLLNHLWIDRRTILTLLVATGRGHGKLVVLFLPLLRWLKRKLAGMAFKFNRS